MTPAKARVGSPNLFKVLFVILIFLEGHPIASPLNKMSGA
jgi:hypothetical protein